MTKIDSRKMFSLYLPQLNLYIFYKKQETYRNGSVQKNATIWRIQGSESKRSCFRQCLLAVFTLHCDGMVRCVHTSLWWHAQVCSHCAVMASSSKLNVICHRGLEWRPKEAVQCNTGSLVGRCSTMALIFQNIPILSLEIPGMDEYEVRAHGFLPRR